MLSLNSTARTLRDGSLLLALPVLLGAAGCGKSTGTVSGKVLYQNKPLPGGNVNFMSEGPNAAVKTAEIQSDGSYTVTGVPVGPARITVQGISARNIPVVKGQEGAAPPKPKEVFVPPQYGSAEQSGLKYDVQPGSQAHDIELK